MSKLRPSDSTKFKLLAGALLLLGALTVALVLPKLTRYAHQQSSRLVKQADAVAEKDSSEAVVNYEMASLLSPKDHSIILKLANLYKNLNRSDAAISVLRRLPSSEGDLKIARLLFTSGQLPSALDTLNLLIDTKAETVFLIEKSRVLLELGRTDEATATAQQALDYALDDTTAQFQLGLCLAISSKTSDLGKLMATMAPGEALDKLKQTQLSELGLAKVLYQEQLLNSAQAVLAKLPSPNSESYLLRGEIALTQKNLKPTELETAKASLSRGLAADPGNLALHKLMREIYVQLKDQAGQTKEAELIKQLQTGRI